MTQRRVLLYTKHKTHWVRPSYIWEASFQLHNLLISIWATGGTRILKASWNPACCSLQRSLRERALAQYKEILDDNGTRKRRGMSKAQSSEHPGIYTKSVHVWVHSWIEQWFLNLFIMQLLYTRDYAAFLALQKLLHTLLQCISFPFILGNQQPAFCCSELISTF